MTDLLINGTGFVCEKVAEQTETEFVKTQMAAGFKSELDSSSRFLLLKQAYALCLEKIGAEAKAEDTPPADTKKTTKGGK